MIKNNKTFVRNLIIFSSITIILVLITCGVNNLFGSKVDWLIQHTVFPDYFRQLFYKTGNIFPSFALNIGAGQNIFNIAYYGLFNPIISISYLLPFVNMTTYISIISIIITIIDGLLVYKLLRNNDFNDHISLIGSIIFIMLAPIFFHSHHHIMFVSYMPFLLASLIWVDNYFKGEKCWLISVFVLLIILTSYYYAIASLLCIVIYFIYKYLKNNPSFKFKEFMNVFIKFIGYLLLGVILSAFFLIPTAFALLAGRTPGDSTNVLKLLKPIFNFNGFMYNSYGIGATTIFFISIIGNILENKKAIRFLTICLVIVISIPLILFILNGTLYARDKVLITLTPLVIISICTFLKNLNKFNFKKIIILFLFILLTIILSNNFNLLSCFDFILTLAIIIIYQIKKDNRILYGFLIISFVALLSTNSSEVYVDKNFYNEINDKNIQSLVDYSSKDQFINRSIVLLDDMYYVNKIYNINQLNTSLYSSTSNSEYFNFFSNDMNNALAFRNKLSLDNNSDIMFQTLMGVKYIITNNDAPIGYNKILEKGNYTLYENDFVLSIGYVNKLTLNNKTYLKLSKEEKKEALLEYTITNDSNNYDYASRLIPIDLKYDLINDKNITITNDNSNTILEVKNDSKIQLLLKSPIVDNVLFISFDVLKEQNCSVGDLSITINHVKNKLTCKQWQYANKNNSFGYVISSNKPITSLDIELSKGHYVLGNIDTHTLSYKDVINSVKDSESLIIDKNKTQGDFIVGNIKASEEELLTLTIPYDKSFIVKLNGKVTNYKKVYNSFIGIDIKEGNNHIEIQYKAKGLSIGLIISIIGLCGLVLIIIKEKKYEKA